MNSKLIKATASTMVLGAALVGCTQSATINRPVAASQKATPNDRQAVQAHRSAEKAMLQNDLTAAMTAMEKAVELSPQDAGYRKTLAELYLKTGRFVSAEATYADVIKLNPSDSKAAFYLAFCQLAQGRTSAALVQLGTMDIDVDVGDLGLAYALAGQTSRAIALLEPAAHTLSATARLRQNLALAYALAGDWKRARIVAEQDISPAEVNKRLQQWAALASAAAPETRVAMLLGVSANSDPGQPARLALAPAAPPAAASAQAEQPAAPAAPAVAEAQSEPVAPAAPTPVVAAVAAPAPVPAAATPVQAVAVATAPAALAKTAALPVAQTRIRKSSSGRFVVQIGAYRSPDQVEHAYAALSRRFGFIAKYEPLSTQVHIDGKGVFHRLSIAGFDSQAAAADVCRTIKAQGGACFVRTNAGDAPVQWASRYTRKA
jgi:Flp pilus assembly protein TadD